MAAVINKREIPTKPGVYFFRGNGGRVLYIGKAASLHDRVGSYFNGRPKDPRISRMLELAEKVDWQETGSEIEALILESQSIKRERPEFNIMLRDDKQYLYVVFTRDEFSRILLTHRPTDSIWKKAANIGPFTDGVSLKVTLRLLRRIFPYCTCKQKHNNYCLNYHIGKCLGFCCLKSRENNLRFTNYDLRVYRKNIRAIKEVLSGKRKSLIKKLQKEMAVAGQSGDFKKAIDLRNKAEKLKTVFENAQIIKNITNVSNVGLDDEAPDEAPVVLEELASALGLGSVPARIEGYDISNMQGRFATGSMVVFINGQPDKNQYRRFRIRLAGSPDDMAMLREVLLRRFNHPEWRRPDLIIVDGGRAQLAAARQAVPGRIPIIALTKDSRHHGDHIFTTNQKEPTRLSALPNPVCNLILQIDSEAHRFAINYYRKLHRKVY